jgi:hypothetical protein
LTGICRFERNQADAISSKIGVVSPRSNPLPRAAGARLGGSAMTGTFGANSESASGPAGSGGAAAPEGACSADCSPA